MCNQAALPFYLRSRRSSPIVSTLDPLCCLWLGGPYRLEDGEHIFGGDAVDWLRADDRTGISLEGGCPLNDFRVVPQGLRKYHFHNGSRSFRCHPHQWTVSAPVWLRPMKQFNRIEAVLWSANRSPWISQSWPDRCFLLLRPSITVSVTITTDDSAGGGSIHVIPERRAPVPY